MKRVIIIISTILFVLMNSAIAQPRSGKINSKELQNMKVERMQKVLNLTEVQETKIRDLHFENQKMVLDTKNKIANNKLMIHKMMADNKIDDAKLISLTKENIELQANIKLSHTKMWLDVYKVLDDNQKSEWAKTFGKFGDKSRHSNVHSKKGFGSKDCKRF